MCNKADCNCRYFPSIHRIDFEWSIELVLDFWLPRKTDLYDRPNMIASTSQIANYLSRYRSRASIPRYLKMLELQGRVRRVSGFNPGETARWELTDAGKKCLTCINRKRS